MLKDKYEIIAVAIFVAYLIYWSAFQANAYYEFRLTAETANHAYPMYYYLNYNVPSPLNFLVIGNQIEPLQLLVLPLFALFPSSLTLVVLKAIVLSVTGLLLFFIAKKLIKNGPLASLLFLGFLFNPATINIMLFDYHSEVFILPFYLLTFYFFMRADRKLFFASLILLLLTMESALATILALGAGLAVYAHFDKTELAGERMKMALSILVLSLVAILLYNILYYLIAPTNTLLPTALKLYSYPLVPLLGGGISGSSQYQLLPIYTPQIMLTCLLLMFCGFGIFNIFEPVPTLIFSIPWLAGLFVLQNSVFLYAWRFVFLLSGVLVGALMGLSTLVNRKDEIIGFFKRFEIEIQDYTQLVTVLFILISVPFYIAFEPNVLSKNPQLLTNQEAFLFTTTTQNAQYFNSLNKLFSEIPTSANVMAQSNFMPNLIQRQHLEPIRDNPDFPPDIVAFDPIGSRGLYPNTTAILSQYLKAHSNYTQEGQLIISNNIIKQNQP